MHEEFREALGGGVKSPGTSSVSLVQYAPEGSTYEVSTANGGLMVLSEVHYPVGGRPPWTAKKCRWFVRTTCSMPSKCPPVGMKCDALRARRNDQCQGAQHGRFLALGRVDGGFVGSRSSRSEQRVRAGVKPYDGTPFNALRHGCGTFERQTEKALWNGLIDASGVPSIHLSWDAVCAALASTRFVRAAWWLDGEGVLVGLAICEDSEAISQGIDDFLEGTALFGWAKSFLHRQGGFRFGVRPSEPRWPAARMVTVSWKALTHLRCSSHCLTCLGLAVAALPKQGHQRPRLRPRMGRRREAFGTIFLEGGMGGLGI